MDPPRTDDASFVMDSCRFCVPVELNMILASAALHDSDDAALLQSLRGWTGARRAPLAHRR